MCYYNEHMRLLLLVSTVLVLVNAAARPCAAAGDQPTKPAAKTYTQSDKLVRGLVNIVTSPLELPRQLREQVHGGSTVRAWTLGLLQGIGYTVVRASAGVYEVLTFPAPAPSHYTPVLEPEYVWDASQPERP